MNYNLLKQLETPGIINILVKKYGYTFSSLCNCDNHRTLKFIKGSQKHGGNRYELSWRIYRDEFAVRKNGRTIRAFDKVRHAEKYLDDLHSENPPAYILNATIDKHRHSAM